MTTINLKDFYPWYTHDEYIEVSEEQAVRGRLSAADRPQQGAVFPRLCGRDRILCLCF